jgi:hypothetical protein
METPLNRAIRFLNAWAAVAVFSLGCAAPQHKEATASTYEGPITDPHIHVFFDEKIAKNVHPTTPSAIKKLLKGTGIQAGLMVMATGDPAATCQQNDRLIARTKELPKAFAIGSVNPHNGDAALLELERMVKAGGSLGEIASQHAAIRRRRSPYRQNRCASRSARRPHHLRC